VQHRTVRLPGTLEARAAQLVPWFVVWDVTALC
jgi:hypothetical protein